MRLILQSRTGGHVHECDHAGEAPEVVTLGPATFRYHVTVREGAVYRECTGVALPSPLAIMRAAKGTMNS